MFLHDLKHFLEAGNVPVFVLPNHQAVPAHYHVTEVGEVTKRFVDCGGKSRTERKAVLQLWVADDTDHRLSSQRLLDILHKCESSLGLGNLEVGVEYQGAVTKELYGLSVNDKQELVLVSEATACLALEACGVEETAVLGSLLRAGRKATSCSPSMGCC